jgi:transposase-like protein
MTGIQKLLISILPKKWAADMEAESRSWMVRCPSCSFERSVWELGGIRWKAAGNPRRHMHCPQCGNSGWHTIICHQDTRPAGS